MHERELARGSAASPDWFIRDVGDYERCGRADILWLFGAHAGSLQYSATKEIEDLRF
jgi:hypothetical protein